MKSSDRYDVVRKTQIALFQKSGIDKQDFDSLIELFSPRKLAEFLGLDYVELDEIPSNDPNFEIAGTLDRTNRVVCISMRFPVDQRRLTGLHEIVHWMLHQHVGRDILHRDRPVSDFLQNNSVKWYEREATNVACQYLMTEKMVKDRFSLLFDQPLDEPIQFNEDVAFYLMKDIEELRWMDENKRAMLLATTQVYGRPIMPLYRQFKVSPTAMAIRLKELRLLAPDRSRGKPNLRIVR